MQIKRSLGFMLTGLMLCTIFVSGCSSQNRQETKRTEQSLQETVIETKDDNSANILVVYYSATGNTEKVAKAIAEESGGDTYNLFLLGICDNVFAFRASLEYCSKYGCKII